MTLPARRSLLAAVLAAAVATACAGDGARNTAEAVADTPDAADAPGEVDDTDTPTTQADGPGSGDGSPAASGGEATWLGETLAFDRVTCGEQPGVGYVLRARNDDLDLAVVYDGGDDPTNPSYDFAGPDRVELYRGVPGGSIGDGEGYEARPDLDAVAIDGITGSESGAYGTVSLVPDDGTTAPEVNPDGGELTFAITC